MVAEATKMGLDIAIFLPALPVLPVLPSFPAAAHQPVCEYFKEYIVNFQLPYLDTYSTDLDLPPMPAMPPAHRDCRRQTGSQYPIII